MLAAVFMWIGSGSIPVQAQETRETSRTFQAAFLFGGISGPATPELESAMSASGFADNVNSSQGWFSGSSGSLGRYPFTYKESPMTFTAQYRLRSPISVGVIIATTGERETIGHQGFTQSLILNHAARSIAVTASARFKVLRFEFGPAWNQTRVREHVSLPSSPAWTTENKPGFIAGASLAVPVYWHFYLDAGLQYRYIGSSVIGPYTPTAYAEKSATFPATQLNFSHWFFGIGPGIRF